MAVHGRRGVVKISGNTVASVTSFSYDEKADTVDATAMGDSSKSYVAGLVDGSGSIECRFVNTDYAPTSGAGAGVIALAAGTQVSLSLIPDSAGTTGTTMFYGLSAATVTLNSYTLNSSFDGVVGCTFGFQGKLARFSG